MKILITLAQVILFLILVSVSIGVTGLGGWMMWSAGLNPSVFGTLGLVFFGFFVCCVGLAATGIVVAFSFVLLGDAKAEVDRTAR